MTPRAKKKTAPKKRRVKRSPAPVAPVNPLGHLTREARKRMYELRRDGASIGKLADLYLLTPEQVGQVLSESIK